jgi:hypothetical protein
LLTVSGFRATPRGLAISRESHDHYLEHSGLDGQEPWKSLENIGWKYDSFVHLSEGDNRTSPLLVHSPEDFAGHQTYHDNVTPFSRNPWPLPLEDSSGLDSWVNNGVGGFWVFNTTGFELPAPDINNTSHDDYTALQNMSHETGVNVRPVSDFELGSTDTFPTHFHFNQPTVTVNTQIFAPITSETDSIALGMPILQDTRSTVELSPFSSTSQSTPSSIAFTGHRISSSSVSALSTGTDLSDALLPSYPSVPSGPVAISRVYRISCPTCPRTFLTKARQR